MHSIHAGMALFLLHLLQDAAECCCLCI